jgi:2-keto-4-pentenoate hydratase
MQERLGIDQPDDGPLLAVGVHRDRVRVDLDRLIQPKPETETAIVVAEPSCTASYRRVRHALGLADHEGGTR